MKCRRLAVNHDGRDWVVGDLHGCFGQLEEQLQALKFDPSRDRLLSVGDLVDRGPDSLAVLDWEKQPWFYPCLGNHEEILLTALTDPISEAVWVEFNGGEWWLELDEATRASVAQTCRRLPLALEVETRWGRVGIVHADVPTNTPWPDFIADLETGNQQSRHTALWSRKRFSRGLVESISGIDRVVCGHTIIPSGKVRVLGNVWFIDTGGFLHGQDDHYSLTVLPLEDLFRPENNPVEPVPDEKKGGGINSRRPFWW